MIMKILTFILLIFFNSFALADPLKNAIESEIRSDKNVARDVYRHPYETLTFFGIRPDTVSYTHLTLPTTPYV